MIKSKSGMGTKDIMQLALPDTKYITSASAFSLLQLGRYLATHHFEQIPT